MIENPPPPVQRFRLTYSKKGDARFIGHLDLARFWERVFRRIDLPMAYSQGFNPQPRMQFASALPVGIEAECEMVDVWLTERVDVDRWLDPIRQTLPPGFALSALVEVSLDLPAMQASLRRALYEVCWSVGTIDEAELRARVQALWDASEIVRPHHKKPDQTYDLRPLIEKLEIICDESAISLLMTLSSSPTANGRAPEVVAALGLDASPHQVTRLDLFLEEPKPAEKSVSTAETAASF